MTENERPLMNPTESGEILTDPRIKQRIDELINRFIAEDLTAIRTQAERYQDVMPTTPEQVEQNVKERQQEWDRRDEKQRLAKLLNNFHCYFPGGQYRSQIEQSANLTLSPAATENLELMKRVVRDLDQTLQQKGYSEATAQFGKQDLAVDPSKLRILAEMYIELVDQGYDPMELRK